MPRPNVPREIYAEDHLAARLTIEREREGWTYASLAARMTNAGCPIDKTAIYKIEKGEPRRRIVVDELVAFAKVFGLSLEELLVPPELAMKKQVTDLVIEWTAAGYRIDTATAERDEAWAALGNYLNGHPDAVPAFESVFGKWAEIHFEEVDRDFFAADRMWQLTKDMQWGEIAKREFDLFVDRRARTEVDRG